MGCARWQIYDFISGDKGRLIRQGGGGGENRPNAIQYIHLVFPPSDKKPIGRLVEPEHTGTPSFLMTFDMKQLTVGPAVLGPYFPLPYSLLL